MILKNYKFEAVTIRVGGLAIEKFRKFKVPNKGPFVSMNGQKFKLLYPTLL